MINMKSNYVLSYDNKKIFYLVNRIKKGSFIFFLHGAGSNHSVFKPFFKAFKNQNYIAMDYRGHGHSENAEVSISDIIDDIMLILQKEKVKKVKFIGNSLGATIALEFYKAYPSLVEKLVLFTLFSRRYVRFSWFYGILANVCHFWLRPFRLKRKLKFQDYHKYKKRPIWYYPYLDIRGTPVISILKLVVELFKTPIDFSIVKIPSLVIVAKHDFSAKNKLIINDCKKNNVVCEVMNGSHVVLTREFEKAIKIVRGFL